MPLLVSAALVWHRGELIVQRRPPTARHGAGRLELPGGKLEPGEAPREALARELIEEWGDVADGWPIGDAAEVLFHTYPPPGPAVLLMVFHVDAGSLDNWKDEIRPMPGAEVLRFAPEALPADQFLEADRGFIARIAAGEFGDGRRSRCLSTCACGPCRCERTG